MIRWWMIAAIALLSACAPLDAFFGTPVFIEDGTIEVVPENPGLLMA